MAEDIGAKAYFETSALLNEGVDVSRTSFLSTSHGDGRWLHCHGEVAGLLTQHSASFPLSLSHSLKRATTSAPLPSPSKLAQQTVFEAATRAAMLVRDIGSPAVKSGAGSASGSYSHSHSGPGALSSSYAAGAGQGQGRAHGTGAGAAGSSRIGSRAGPGSGAGASSGASAGANGGAGTPASERKYASAARGRGAPIGPAQV